MLKINRKVKISGIVGILILSSLFLSTINFKGISERREQLPAISAIWTTNFIHVKNNWTDFTEITGDGSWETPYLIENVNMDASSSPTDSGILIEDEDTYYFKIKNCTVTNWGAAFEDGGIKLLNSSNGIITNNTCSGSSIGSGIVLLGDLAGSGTCDNNTIYQNIANNNVARGIFVELYCDGNNIYDNELHNNNVGLSLFDHCVDNTITDNSITDNSWGVELAYSSNLNNIEFNEIESNSWGIYIHEECDENYLYNNTIMYQTSSGVYIDGDYLKQNTGNIIHKNYISLNSYDGIEFDYSDYSTISNNEIIDNGHMGIEFNWYCNWNDIIENTINRNGDGIVESGITIWNYCQDNNITLNTIEDNWEYGIHMGSQCTQNVINNNTISGHDWGIRFYSGCDVNGIINNTITDNSGPSFPYGILIEYQCEGNNIENNIIDNTVTGIQIGSSSNSTDVTGNTISNCSRGLYFSTSGSINNVVWLNYFLENTEHARDNSGIGANYFYKSLVGNYWDDYSGIDCNGDQIGDTPYDIPGTATNQDLYPLWTQPLPILTEHNIEAYDLFTTEPPEFNLTVSVYSLNQAWYQLSDGVTVTNNQTIATTGINNTIDPALWEQMANGTVTIAFYADDPCGYTGRLDVIVRKDILGPNIQITYPPEENPERTIDERHFEYTVDETADTIWYRIEGGPMHIVTGNGDFDQTEWETAFNATAEGNYFVIVFYANDTHGNVAQDAIHVYPVTIIPPPEPTPNIPFGNIFLIFSLIAIATLIPLVNRKITKK